MIYKWENKQGSQATCKSGQAMILTLFVMLLLLLLGEAVLLAGISVQRSALLATRQKQAYYIAEAGINQAIAMVAGGRSDIASLVNEPYAGGILLTASCTGPVQDVYTVNCTSEYPDPGDHTKSAAGFFSFGLVTAQFKLTKPGAHGSDPEQDATGEVAMISWQ